jgi:hypothetical protein
MLPWSSFTVEYQSFFMFFSKIVHHMFRIKIEESWAGTIATDDTMRHIKADRRTKSRGGTTRSKAKKNDYHNDYRHISRKQEEELAPSGRTGPSQHRRRMN